MTTVNKAYTQLVCVPVYIYHIPAGTALWIGILQIFLLSHCGSYTVHIVLLSYTAGPNPPPYQPATAYPPAVQYPQPVSALPPIFFSYIFVHEYYCRVTRIRYNHSLCSPCHADYPAADQQQCDGGEHTTGCSINYRGCDSQGSVVIHLSPYRHFHPSFLWMLVVPFLYYTSHGAREYGESGINNVYPVVM